LKRLKQYSLLAVSLLVLGRTTYGKPVRSEQVELTVCLMNDARESPDTVAQVQRQVDSLLLHSAIHIRWLEGGDPGRTAEERWMCSHPQAFRVVILRWMPTAKQAMANELGQAFVGVDGRGMIADLFLDRIRQLQEERNIDFAQLLAQVTAHELGHLLLGAVEVHSAGGLMQAQMNENTLHQMARGGFHFSRQQEKNMHERVKAAGQVALLAENRSDKFRK
jgi:hypothetical protein